MRRFLGILAALAISPAALGQSTPAAVSYGQSSATESNHVLKTGPGRLYSLIVNSGASAGWLLLYDATAAPSDGTVAPALCLQISASATGSLSQQLAPWPFNNGAVAVFSTGTGCFNQAKSATATFMWQVQ